MTYEVRRSGQVYMQTTDERCRNTPKIEAEMQQAGYEIYVDGIKVKTRKAGCKNEQNE